MAIACSFLLPSPNETTINVAAKNIFLRRPWKNKRMLSPPVSAATFLALSDVESLRECGVTLSDLGDSCVLRMAVENGSAAKLMLPSGLITSFKAEMWHGGTMELLHTTVSPNAVVQGGLSLALGCDQAAGLKWSPNVWALHQVKGNPQDSIQLELVSSSEGGLALAKHIITLRRDVLTSEVVVSNLSTSSLRLTGSSICHLTVSTPDATYAIGLQGSDIYIRPPFQSDFSIIPPDFNTSTTSAQDPNIFDKLSSIWESRNSNVEDDVESLLKQDLQGEEEDNYKHLTQKLSRIYTDAPRNFTIIDRGRRNSVTLERNGFKEVYMLSPGSEHEWYNKYSYICIGHAALLEPIILNAQSEWRGELRLWNPNS